MGRAPSEGDRCAVRPERETDHLELAKLVRGDDIEDPVADAIVAAWYSGLYDTGWGQAVSDFNGALVWAAMTFTKPWANCGGATGYWADAPTG